ncbi:MAG: DUF2062 domain-containing protein [Candidatus Rokuibacteriota bacterium]
MTGRRPRLGAQLHALLHLDDPPGKIARALAVGVFIGCTPFWGLQTVLSIAVAWIFGLNRAATVTGTWLNLPWVAPFVYGAALKVGGLLVPDPDGLRAAWLDYLLEHWQSLSWRDALALFRELSVALLVGSAVVGAVAALGAYVVAFAALSARRTRRGGGARRPRRAA